MNTAPDISLLDSLFPPTVVSAGEIKGIYPEVEMYKQHFGGKSWPEVKRKYYEWHTDAFSLMDHSTLKLFIGGYLNTILSDPDSNTSEFLIYFAGNNRFVEFCDELTVEQTEFLLSTIDWIIEDEYFNDEDRSKYSSIRAIVTDKWNAD